MTERVDPVSELSEEQIQEFKEAFALFDKDGDDRVSIADLTKVMENLGLDSSEGKLKAMLEEADPQNDGSINFHSFLTLLARKQLDLDTDSELQEAFRYYDRDNDGLISPHDLKLALGELGEHPADGELEAIVMEHGDSHINYTAFVKLVTAK
eukprot:TRINITY_DN343_c1_g1_i1.p1 TRINITY_DN343_c1_g1~~TRINITY_DN343_c1_g1_i1.p1  ORF type:complete len:166 (-),score=42.71 TRINITY_DN343_c1_g1_i1:581-1039(-)